MKKLFSILSITLLILSGCQKDEVFSREDYIGSWTCDESSAQNGTSKFTVHIKKGTGDADVIIENFYNFGFQNTIKGTVAEDELTITSQTFAVSNTVQGSGSMIAKNKINLSYTVKDSSGTDNVTAVLTKQ